MQRKTPLCPGHRKAARSIVSTVDRGEPRASPQPALAWRPPLGASGGRSARAGPAAASLGCAHRLCGHRLPSSPEAEPLGMSWCVFKTSWITHPDSSAVSPGTT